MQLTPLAFAAAAAAFVIIPELSEADENIFKALPIHVEPLSVPIPAESHKVLVPCKQCEGKNSNLQLNFNVVDHTRLVLNGFEVYPNADPWHGLLAATVESSDRESTKQNLGYSLAIAPEAMDKDSLVQLLDVELRVIEVGNQFVDNVPVVNVKLIKAPSGEIAIFQVDTTSAKMSGCNSMACQAKEVMTDAFKALKGLRPFKGCHGRLQNGKDKGHHAGKPVRPQSGHGPDAPHRRPHPHHGHHFGDGHRHEWGRLITNVAAQIFLPILMGITAGVAVALLAMAVCSVFSRLTSWFRGRRESRRSLCPYRRGRATLTAHEEAAASEKTGLMVEEVEIPPQYDDSKN